MDHEHSGTWEPYKDPVTDKVLEYRRTCTVCGAVECRPDAVD